MRELNKVFISVSVICFTYIETSLDNMQRYGHLYLPGWQWRMGGDKTAKTHGTGIEGLEYGTWKLDRSQSCIQVMQWYNCHCL